MDKRVGQTIPINSIKLGERVRKDMGDLKGLANSMQEHGLLHPIVLAPDNELVCGQRRLEAARLLGWKEIPYTEIDVEHLLKAERDENEVRKDLTLTEKVAIGRLIEEQERPKAKERIRNANVARSKKNPHSGNLPERVNHATKDNSTGNVREIVGGAIGLAGRTYEMAKAVVEAAEKDHEAFGDLPAAMDESGNVAGTYNELQRRKGKVNGRHPIHRKTAHLKSEKALTSALHSLDGILVALEGVSVETLGHKLEKDRARDFGSQLIQIAKRLSKIGRLLKNG